MGCLFLHSRQLRPTSSTDTSAHTREETPTNNLPYIVTSGSLTPHYFGIAHVIKLAPIVVATDGHQPRKALVELFLIILGC
jgi:hypothetical protein